MSILPVQVAVQRVYEDVANEATTDLRGAVDKIEGNLEEKKSLRRVLQKMEIYKNALSSGDLLAAGKAKREMTNSITKAHLPDDSELVKLATQSPVGVPGSGGGLEALPDGAVKTSGGYTIVPEGGTRWSIYGPGQKPGVDKPTTHVWGDPHVDESDGTRWDFTKDSNWVLPDGTNIFVDTSAETGHSVTKGLTIASGDDRIEITGINGSKPSTGAVNKDAEAWLEGHLAAERPMFLLENTTDGSVHWHKFQGGNEQGRITGAFYDSGKDRYDQKLDGKVKLKEKLDEMYKSFNRVLDAEIQSRSDVGQKLQFELTQANNIFNRMIKAQSDANSKEDRMRGAVLGNVRG